MSEWTHIIADCLNCDFSKIHSMWLTGIQAEVSRAIKENGLTELGNYYHIFGDDAFTGVIALAESHVSIHTWPEHNFVSLDIYACNVTQDNSVAAENILRMLLAFITPGEIKKQVIKR